MNLLQIIKSNYGKIFQKPFLVIVKNFFIKNSLSRTEYFKIRSDIAEIKLFGIIMSINYPLYFFIWNGRNDFVDITLRIIATLLCITLLFDKYWIHRNQKLFAFYWYFTLTFCLPFFFTFMLLKHHVSAIWLMNCMSALFFNLLITSLLGFFITMIIGISLGVIVFFTFISDLTINLGTVDLNSIFWTFFAAIVIGATFSYQKIQLQQQNGC